MAKINAAEINQRVAEKLEELKATRAETERARKVVSRVEPRVEELRDELKQVRRALDRRRAAVKEVREDLHVAELEVEIQRLLVVAGELPEDVAEANIEGGAQQVAELGARLDDLAGLIEEGIATRDRLIDRLDRLSERRGEAEQALRESIAERDDDRRALERLRARRRRIRERKDRPSEHFAYAEFDCNNGQELPEPAYPAVKDWCERIGEPLRERFGPVHINSGYRPAAYNSSVGGESNSLHIYDFPGRNFRAVAVDVACERGTPQEWYAFTAGKADGRGSYATFHHADTRSRIGWSPATWSG